MSSGSMLAVIPIRITRPRSAPIMPAAAIGPGVGGTRQCVMVRPSPSAQAEAARVIPAFFDSARLSGVRITNPESA